MPVSKRSAASSSSANTQVGDAYARREADGQRWVIGTAAAEMALEVVAGQLRLVSLKNKLAGPVVELVDASQAASLLAAPAPAYTVEQLWLRTVKPSAAADPAEDHLQIDVRAGDLLGFAVDARGGKGAPTQWTGTVEYVDGERYNSTDDAELAQGPAWRYLLYDPLSGAMEELEETLAGPRGKMRVPGEASRYRASAAQARAGDLELTGVIGSTGRHRVSATEPQVGSSWLQPSFGCNAVRAWRAPRAGRVTLSGAATLPAGEGAVDVKVLRIAEHAPEMVEAEAHWELEDGQAHPVTAQGRPALQLDLTLRGGCRRVRWHVQALPGASVFRQWQELENPGTEPLPLGAREGLWAASLGASGTAPLTCHWMDAAYFILGPVHSEVIGESYRRSLAAPVQATGDCRYYPWLAVQHSQGSAAGLFVALDTFSNWRLELERAPGQALRLSVVQTQLRPSSWVAPQTELAPGETLELPTLTLGVFKGDLDDMAERVYAWQYEYMWDYIYEDWYARPVWASEVWYGDQNLQQQWAGRLGRADADALDYAREYGMGLVHNDAGWGADPNIWTCNWEGPDFARSLRQTPKSDLRWLLWLPGEPQVNALDTRIGCWGNLMYRVDGIPWGNTGWVRSFHGKLRRFLDEHPRSTHQGWHGFNWQRLTSHSQQDNDMSGFDLNNYASSYLSFPDKWYDGVGFRRDAGTRRRWLAEVEAWLGDVPVDLQDDMKYMVGLYHYLQAQGVAGRWSFIAHPRVEGELPYYCLQRVSHDHLRALIVLRYPAAGEVTVYPRRLRPEASYLVEWASGRPGETRSGADLMANGIHIREQAPGELIFLNLPHRPGSGADRVPPTAPGRALMRRETNLGHTGIMVYWSPGADDNWVSHYEVKRGDTVLGRVAQGLCFFDRSAGWDAGAQYAVCTVDGDGNASPWTAAVPFAPEPPAFDALGAHYPEAGRNGWRAETSADGRTYQPMTWVPRAGIPTFELGGGPMQRGGVEGYWEGAETARCGRGWQQTSVAAQCVRAWTAPQSGDVRVTGRAMKEFYRRRSRALCVRILLNGDQVWPAQGWAEVRPDDLTGCTHDLHLRVRQGDTLRFVLDRGHDPEDEILCWMPRIVYGTGPASTLPAPPAVRILCGADRPYVDATGNTWSADRFYAGGRPFAAEVAVAGATPTPQDGELYRHGRAGQEFTYSIPVPPGLYAVRLKLAETEHGYAFQRPMDIAVNGQGVAHNLDVCQAAHGPRTAYERVFRYIVPDAAGNIVLRFRGGWDPAQATGEALVQAIEVAPEIKPALRINCGNEHDWVDWNSFVWSADNHHEGGRALAAAVEPAAPPEPWAGVVTKSRHNGPWYGLWISPRQRWLYGAGEGQDVEGGLVATGRWTHVALVQDGAGGTRTLYVDGRAEGAGAAQPATGEGDLLFGTDGARQGIVGMENLGNAFKGQLRDVRLYRRAVGGAEIAQLAIGNAGAATGDASLAGWWKLDEKDGLTAADASGKGHAGTLENDPAWSDGGLRLNGWNACVRVRDTADLRFGAAGSYTLSAWVYVQALPGTYGLALTAPGDPPIKHVSPTLYDQALYHTARAGKEFGYALAVPPGLYTVHLKFAELWLPEPGGRPMDITVNGRKVWERWDPATAAGRTYAAADLRVEDVAPDRDGRIVIRLSAAGENDAILQAIEVE